MATPGNQPRSLEPGANAQWERVKEIFSSALERKGHERDLFVAAECGADVELRHEVESLLAAHVDAVDFIEEPPPQVKPFLEEDTVTLERAPGTRIGSYELVREIGQGGMGSVYLAVRADHEFEKRVAIKLIRPGMVSDVVVRRFRDERQILARLEHANIARLLDGGTVDGLPYFVMEYVEGVPITVYCHSRGSLPTQRIDLFLRVCAAVQYAHERRIVHRDLKPTNVLIKKDGQPKLLDFGIAKVLSADKGSTMETTLAGMRMMTPAYASPEQLRGEPGTYASDIYSLGILLHEILAGSRFGPLSLSNANLPPGVAEVIAKAIEQDPAARYVSVEAFSAGLRACITGHPQPPSKKSLAVLPFRSLHGDSDTESYLGIALADAVITKLSNVRHIQVRSTRSVENWNPDTDPTVAGAELGVDFVLDGHIRKAGDRIRVTVQLVGVREKAPVWASQFEARGDDLLHIEDSLSGQLANALGHQLSTGELQRTHKKDTVNPAAYQAYLKGRWHFGIQDSESLAKALVAFSEATAEDPQYAQAHAGIADYHIWMAMWGGVPASESIAAARTAACKAVELDNGLAEGHAAYGLTLWARDRDATLAERELKIAIQLNENLGRAHQWLGLLYSMMGRHEEAIASLERAREKDPDCVFLASSQALCAYVARDYSRALEILSYFEDVDHVRTAAALGESIRALCRLQQRDAVGALTSARRAVEVSDRSPHALAALASALFESGDPAAARKIQADIEALAARQYVSPFYLGQVQMAAGKPRAALDCLNRGAREGDWWVLWSKVEPRFDPLRNLRAYRELVRKLRLSGDVASPVQPRPRWLWAVAAVVLALAIVWAVRTLIPATPLAFQQLQLTRLTTNGLAAHAAISPDGKYVAYSAREGSRQALWLRQISSSATVQITPPMDAELMRLSFAGDGGSLHFLATQRNDATNAVLYEVPILGGTLRVLKEHVAGPASVSPDGKRIALIQANQALRRDELSVSSLDGFDSEVIAVRNYPDHFSWASTPAWSNDGTRILCAIEGSDDRGFYSYPMAVTVRDHSVRILKKPRWQYIEQATWTGDGSGVLIIAREPALAFLHLWHLPYPSGPPRRLVNDLSDYSGLTVTTDTKALVSVQFQTLANVYTGTGSNLDRGTQITPGSGRYFDLRWTPQGKLLYSSDASGAAEIWVMNADGTGQRELTTGPGRSYAPNSTPSGEAVVFHSNRTGSWNIWKMNADGNRLQQLTSGPQDSNWPQLTPDGNSVVYHHTGAEAMWNLWRVPVQGGKPEQLTTRLTVMPDVSSRDGSIACWFGEDPAKPRWQLAVLKPGGGAPVRTFDVSPTAATDSAVRWTPDGKGITFIDNRGGIGNIWLQLLDGSASRPLTHFAWGQIFSFDWSKDGRLAYSRGLSTSDVVLAREVHR